MQDFVHLHVHTQYSILDGQASIPKLVDKAIANGMKGIAVTDHGAMFGIKEFFNYVNKKNGGTNGEIKDLKKKIAALEKGETESENPEEELAECRKQLQAAQDRLFKPIIGCEMYVARRGLKDKDGKHNERKQDDFRIHIAETGHECAQQIVVLIRVHHSGERGLNT